MPLVAAEAQRINVAFQTVSAELSAVVTALRDLDLDNVGTPSCDRSVATGMSDLRTALSRLLTTSDACAQAMGRHSGVSDGVEPGAETDAADEGGQP